MFVSEGVQYFLVPEHNHVVSYRAVLSYSTVRTVLRSVILHELSHGGGQMSMRSIGFGAPRYAGRPFNAGLINGMLSDLPCAHGRLLYRTPTFLWAVSEAVHVDVMVGLLVFRTDLSWTSRTPGFCWERYR